MRSAPSSGTISTARNPRAHDHVENFGRRLILHVGDLQRGALGGRLTDAGIADADMPLLDGGDQSVVHAVGGAQTKFARCLVVIVDCAGVRLGKLHRLGDDGIQHLREIEGGVHRLADLAQGAQLGHRLRQLVGADFDLLLQIGIGLLQSSRHVVELIGERLQFVAGLDGNPLAEIAAPDARGAGSQGLNGADHLAGKEQARDEGKAQGSHKQDAGSLDGRIKRSVGLRYRQFDKNEPSQRTDMGIGGEHAPALNIVRLLKLLRRLPGAGCSRGLHLRQAREVGIAQHQADIGVRNEARLRIHHIGLSAIAHFDLGDDVPNELEVNLGDAYSGIAAGAGQRKRHVWLRLAAKVDRAVIDLVRHCFGEFRLLGESRLWLATTSIANRETRNCSCPVESSCESSVIAGT